MCRPYIAITAFIFVSPLNQTKVTIFSGRLSTRKRMLSPWAIRGGTDSMVTEAVMDRCQRVKREAREELRKTPVLNGCDHYSSSGVIRGVPTLLYRYEQHDFHWQSLRVLLTLLGILCSQVCLDPPQWPTSLLTKSIWCEEQCLSELFLWRLLTFWFFFHLPIVILVNPCLYLLDILTSGPQEPEIFVCLFFVFVFGFGNGFSYGLLRQGFSVL